MGKRQTMVHQFSKHVGKQSENELSKILSQHKIGNSVKHRNLMVRGCLFIMRAMLNMPFSDRFPSSEMNLKFFKIYTARQYNYVVQSFMVILMVIPILQTAGLHFPSYTNPVWLKLEIASLSVILIDLLIKKLAVGYICSPRTQCPYKKRESFFTAITVGCYAVMVYTILTERIYGQEEKLPLLKIVRPMFVIMRDANVKESISSKLFSVRIAASLLIFMYFVYIIISVLLGLLIGVVIRPEDIHSR